MKTVNHCTFYAVNLLRLSRCLGWTNCNLMNQDELIEPGTCICRVDQFDWQLISLLCRDNFQIRLNRKQADWNKAICHMLTYIFQVTTWDWTRAEKTFTVYEIMCKILKVRELFIPPAPHSLRLWGGISFSEWTLWEYKVEYVRNALIPTTTLMHLYGFSCNPKETLGSRPFNIHSLHVWGHFEKWWWEFIQSGFCFLNPSQQI